MKRIFGSGSYANVTATLALVLALGGTSYAAAKLAPNSVGTAQIKNNAVTTAKVKDALGTDGRVLVRWSGTEPKLRIMLEGPDEDRLRKWAKDLASAAKKDVP